MTYKDPSLTRWKAVAVASLIVAAGLAVVVAALVLRPVRNSSMVDDRLLGTWMSDADATIAGIRELRDVDEKLEAKYRNLFGKLRVTYTSTNYKTKMDGDVTTTGYEVAGRDETSVVIRDLEPSPLQEYLNTSDFTVIQFDGPDAYWVDSKMASIRERFTRVR